MDKRRNALLCSYIAWTYLVLQTSFSCARANNGEEVSECDTKIIVYSRNQTEKNGTVKTTNYPNSYQDNLRCIYYMVGEPNERVNLTFVDFDVNGVPPRCLHDYVDIYTQVRDVNQDLLTVPLHGRFCGKDKDNLPSLIISMTNILVIGFYTDATGDGKGFQLHYSFIDDSRYRVGTLAAPNVCGFTVQSQTSGVLLSPTYPGMYPDNIFCFYKLQGVKGQRIRLTFNEVDLYSGGKHCPFDYIKVYDGLTNEAEVIDTFCGTMVEPGEPVYTLFSQSENMHIEFVTKSGRKTHLTIEENQEAVTLQKGFNASFEISNNFVNLDYITEGEHIPGTECDRRIRSKANGPFVQSNGTVTSPYYPRNYPLEVKCHYYIDGLVDAQNLENVQLYIEHIDIGEPKEDGRCKRGFLRAYSQKQRWGDLLLKKDRMGVGPSADEEFCGQMNQSSPEIRRPIVTDNPRLVLVFSSIDAVPGSGFKATYQFLTDYAIPGTPVNGDRRCHFLYNSNSSNHGTFNSPRHPSNYPAKTYCIYDFRGQEGELVRITFENFRIEGEAPNCTKDYIEVFRVMTLNQSFKELTSTRVAKYCGDRQPGPQEEDTNSLKVVLHSDEEGTRNGFRAKYEFIKRPAQDKRCFFNITSGGGGKIELPISPHTQHKYPTNITCEWLIWGRMRQSLILLTFEEFYIEGNPLEKIGCGNAVLKIYTQKTAGMPVYELCGEKKTIQNMKILSSTNFLRLKFISSAKATGAKGFLLPWTEILPMKGGKCSGFQCKINKYCISSALKCDGVNNCGIDDNSDETTQCLAYRQHGALPIILGVVGTIIVVIVIVVFVVHRRRKGLRTKKETIQVRFLTRSVSDDQAPSGINGAGGGAGLGVTTAGDSLLREKTEKVSIV